MSLLTYLFGDDENARRAEAADAQLRELNRNRYGVDYVNGDDWVPPAEQERQIDAAFAEGWQDGKRNVTGVVSGFFKVIGDGLGAILLGVPVWVWAVAGVALWAWLGFPGLSKLRRKLA